MINETETLMAWGRSLVGIAKDAVNQPDCAPTLSYALVRRWP